MTTYGDDIGSIIRRTFGNSDSLLNEDALLVHSTEGPLSLTGSRENIHLRDDSGGGGVGEDNASSQGQVPLDLHALWKLLEKMDKDKSTNKVVGLSSLDGVQDTSDLLDDPELSGNKMSTWELVVLQAVLLSLLILVSILWAFCCKRRCTSDQSSMSEVAMAFARKISGGSSKDLPPSYSKVDLTTIGLTIDDHLNPPPTYDSAAAMHCSGRKSGVIITPLSQRSSRHVSRFSISSVHSLQLGSDDTVVDIEQPRRSQSRVHFPPNLEMGPTPTRSTSLPLPPVLKIEGRKRSAMSEGGMPGSRKSSMFDESGSPSGKQSISLDIVNEEAPTTINNNNNEDEDAIQVFSSSINLNPQSKNPPMI